MLEKIITKLDDEEYKLFIEQMAAGTHSRKITMLVRKSQGEMDKDQVFLKVFKKKRTAQLDHLLRNELSILKKKAEHFIIAQSVTDLPVFVNYYKPYVMAQWCIKKGIHEEARKYAHEALKKATEAGAWKNMLQINKLHLHIAQFLKTGYDTILEELQLLGQRHLEYLNEYMAEEIRYVDFIHAGAYKLGKQLRKKSFEFSPIGEVYIQPGDSKSKIAAYYHYKSLAYSCSGEEAIQYLQKAMDCLEEGLEFFTYQDEKITCLSAQAIEYGMTGNHPQAARNFEEIMSSPGFIQYPGKNSILFNYSTTLVKLKAYKKALRQISIIENSNPDPVLKERIFTMQSVCYIFLEDTKGLKNILPKQLQSYDVSVKVYYRFLYLIYYLLKNDPEAASRELQNLKQTKQINETVYLPLIRIFEKYMLAYDSILYKEKSASARLKALKKELEHFTATPSEANKILPGEWVIEKCKEMLGIEKILKIKKS